METTKVRGRKVSVKRGADKETHDGMAPDPINTIGILGEAAADLAKAAVGYFRQQEHLVHAGLFEGSADSTGDTDWRREAGAAAHDARREFSDCIVNLSECLGLHFASEFLDFVQNVDLTDQVEDFFEVVAEWVNVRRWAANAETTNQPPARADVIYHVGRLEIMIELMQKVFLVAGLKPEHWRR